jgi:DNA-binding transcriptional regulator PaaX
MKQTTKKILLWLHSAEESNERVASVEELRLLLPELKNSGFRSLLNLLKKQQLISQEDTTFKGGYRLTSYGKSSLEAEFPVFSNLMSQWSGGWTTIVFLNAPKSDKQFRYLRKFLINNHCGQLSRGVYLYPGQLATEIEKLLLRMYVGSVLVTGIGGWLFGDERSVVVETFNLSDIKNGYSGISKETYQLLKQKNKQKGSDGRDKQEIYLVFDRLVSLLSTDLGLFQHYFPDDKSGVQLLAELQSLF